MQKLLRINKPPFAVFRIEKNVGDSAFNNWLKHLNFVSLEENTITFSVPTKFLRDWIVNNYSDKIKSEAKNYFLTEHASA